MAINLVSDNRISAVVVLKGGVPNLTYNVRLIQDSFGQDDCFDFDGTLTTDENGNGAFAGRERIAPDSTLIFAFVSYPKLGGEAGGDFYSTPDVPLP